MAQRFTPLDSEDTNPQNKDKKDSWKLKKNSILQGKSLTGSIVKKASGEEEPFSEEKLRYSLSKAGASGTIADRIVAHIRRETAGFAARYNLKRAVMELGPTGHPFEKFVAEILRAQGFATATNQMVRGKCVLHEVDVTAEKGERKIMVECKFHNEPHGKSDVKVAMYVHARFEDIEAAHRLRKNYIPRFHEAWLITNTKLTSDAIRFAHCSNLKAIGWNYPREGNLHDLIETLHLHPITSLVTPTREEKQTLVQNGIVLVKQIKGNRELMTAIGISAPRAARIQNEARGLF